MNHATPESLAAASTQMLRLEPPPTEAEIDGILERMATAFGAGADVLVQARRLLHSQFAIRNKPPPHSHKSRKRKLRAPFGKAQGKLRAKDEAVRPVGA